MVSEVQRANAASKTPSEGHIVERNATCRAKPAKRNRKCEALFRGGKHAISRGDRTARFHYAMPLDAKWG